MKNNINIMPNLQGPNRDLLSISKSYNIAKDHITKNVTTCDIINLVLKPQGVSISQEDLNTLIQLPEISFDFPFDVNTKTAFNKLIKFNKRGHVGVYIWTHIPTGYKYVGSSNNLVYRFNQYWSIFNNPAYQGGKLASLLLKEGMFDNFNLKIIVIPKDIHSKISKISHSILKQYHLLSNKDFKLNTQLVVNLRANKGKTLYIYNKCKNVLLYESPSKIVFIKKN